jgi:glutamate/tyrosine decarboxylase-like PLP-dependent enzyme
MFMHAASADDLGPLAPFDAALHPYRNTSASFASLPDRGVPREEVLKILGDLYEIEAPRWREGFASGAVYHGDEEHIDFVSKAYRMHSQANQLHPDLWPSAAKFEAEIVSMTARMLGADEAGAPFDSEEGVCGCVASGGTESILLAMKAYRDWARAERGVAAPEIVLPVTAHPAFHKAAQYFGLRLRLTPLKEDFTADADAVEAAVGPDTVAIVGSAVNFPYGTIDPIADLAEIARRRGVGMHVDACLGGFFLPWVERLGVSVPPFDFRIPGVTSLSVCTHKYGFAPKGTSVILYRGKELRRRQYFTTSDWPGGLYHSPTFAGSRPGGLAAACWAAMISIGREGYLDAARRILGAAEAMKDAVRRHPDLRLMGRSYGVFAFTSDTVDPYAVLDQMSARKWALTGLQRPAGLHVSTTLRTAQPGVAERFAADLADSVAAARENPHLEGGFAPIYGMAATLPEREVVHQMLKQFMDVYYRL